MKVISLLQPWATLVVIGAKKIETRSWNTKYRGPLLIHASKSKDMGMPKAKHNQFLGTVYNKYAPEAPAFTELPFGAIIGKVELVATFSTDRTLFVPGLKKGNDTWALTEKEIAFGDYTEGRYGWCLKDPIQFKNPVPAKGSLSLWEHPDIHEEYVVCPQCKHIQVATVEHTIPFYSYVHICKKCDYTILESEWEKAFNTNTITNYQKG